MKHTRHDSGFALLLVFAMAAVIAITLYMEMPRAAFEAQREKEQLLIERGEQYVRGIQLFVTEFKRYPQTIDELEKTNNKRFLRRRYVDPMTGKDDWKLLKINAMGVLENSAVQKDAQKEKSQNTFITEYAGIGTSGLAGQNTGGANLAMRRRPSDQAPGPGPAGMPSSTGVPAVGHDLAANPLLGQQPPPGAPDPTAGHPNPQQPDQAGFPGQNPAQPVPVQPGQPYTVGVGQVPPAQPNQPYPPGQPFPPQGQQYPAPGQPYPPAGQQYPAPGQP
jgi:hypothetical protein